MRTSSVIAVCVSALLLSACGKKETRAEPTKAPGSPTAAAPVTANPAAATPAVPSPTPAKAPVSTTPGMPSVTPTGDKPAKPPGPPAKKVKADVAGAKKFFAINCASCHGASGKGDGPAAAALNPKPRDYTDPTWQKSVTDAKILKVIMEGGAANGMSPLMTPWKALLSSKPAIQNGLVAYIRSFGKPPAKVKKK